MLWKVVHATHTTIALPLVVASHTLPEALPRVEESRTPPTDTSRFAAKFSGTGQVVESAENEEELEEDDQTCKSTSRLKRPEVIARSRELVVAESRHPPRIISRWWLSRTPH